MHHEGLGEIPNSGIILVQPKYPENIGASARIAYNFGIAKLFVVTTETFDEERMLKMATHKAAHLVRSMQNCSTTAEAAASFQFIVGTTARLGKQRLQEQSPREVMTELAPHVATSSIALMFGPESSGLSNEDLDLCQFASTIPTARFASINLAQAVAIHCYELYTALHTAPFASIPKSEYANSFELEGMYEHIDELLTSITFVQQNNRNYWMRSVRQFLGRVQLKKREASMIRGVCRKLLWYGGQQPTKQQENSDYSDLQS